MRFAVRVTGIALADRKSEAAKPPCVLLAVLFSMKRKKESEAKQTTMRAAVLFRMPLSFGTVTHDKISRMQKTQCCRPVMHCWYIYY
jgi:hypothetical protein